MPRYCLTVMLIFTLLATAALASGCREETVRYSESNQTVSSEQALRLAAELDPGEIGQVTASEAASLRHEALTDLRNQGEGAAEASDLITRTFPSSTAAVPFYVDRIIADGKPAILMVEATGRPGRLLSDKRVWVIDFDGKVLVSGTR